ncbi:hypothetical protein M8J77_010360 [Diaphorina citri]|nr:hypothetical protein M8J77_020810 [Diaphorina citri]KAI5715085.1 hypothetical protein M8J77_010360 [Diaphorina citri]
MEGLAVRRLAALSEHLKMCLTSSAEVNAKLVAGAEVSQQDRIELEKLRKSSERLVDEIHKLLKCEQNMAVTEEMEKEISEANRLQILAEDLVIELDYRVKSSPANPVAVEPPSTIPFSRGHLPKLQLTNFSGDILKWSEFWDRFTSVVDRRTDLLEVDKLAYLVGSLEGDAKQSIHGLELTNANYQIAVRKLKERFGKPNLIIDAHYAALNRVHIAKNTTGDCRKVFDEIERHLRTLENLGEDVNHNQLRTTIMEKFPQEIIYELRMDMETKGYSVMTLRESLEKILSARETSFAVRNVDEQEPEEVFTTEALVTTVDQRRPRSRGFGRNLPISGRSRGRHLLLVQNRAQSSKSGDRFPGRSVPNKRRSERQKPFGPDPKKRRLECVFCQAEHFHSDCDKVSTLETRKRFLLKEKLCFQCLRKGHMASSCPNKRQCFHCGVVGDHHRCICPEQGNKQSTSSLAATA